MTSEGHGEARRLTPDGGVWFAAPGYLQSQLRVASRLWNL